MRAITSLLGLNSDNKKPADLRRAGGSPDPGLVRGLISPSHPPSPSWSDCPLELQTNLCGRRPRLLPAPVSAWMSQSRTRFTLGSNSISAAPRPRSRLFKWIYRSITAAVPVWRNASINPGDPGMPPAAVTMFSRRSVRRSGTESSQTPRRREPDSNHRFRSCERSLGCCRREMPDR